MSDDRIPGMSQADSTHLTFLLRLRDRTDQVSWEEFHRRYGQLLYRYARSRGASHADAEDVVQEVEMYLFKAIGDFEYDARKGRFRNYLRSAVVHALGRRATRQAAQPAVLDPQTLDYVASEKEASADVRWEREWQLHRLRWAMHCIVDEFEPATIRAFEMHVLAGRSVEDTAATLNLSKGSVYQARSRILRRLKDQLAALDPDNDV
jgi:RNA polymerase sigma factor (sigma-70 family)